MEQEKVRAAEKKLNSVGFQGVEERNGKRKTLHRFSMEDAYEA